MQIILKHLIFSSNNNPILTLCLAFHHREREMMPASSGDIKNTDFQINKTFLQKNVKSKGK